jgi:hypothetical protein
LILRVGGNGQQHRRNENSESPLVPHDSPFLSFTRAAVLVAGMMLIGPRRQRAKAMPPLDDAMRIAIKCMMAVGIAGGCARADAGALYEIETPILDLGSMRAPRCVRRVLLNSRLRISISDSAPTAARVQIDTRC